MRRASLDDPPSVRAPMQGAAPKVVTVVGELMARFDEASNIRWAKNLQEAGVQMSHGLVGLKTHCKLALLVRRGKDGKVRRYAHLGTADWMPRNLYERVEVMFRLKDPALCRQVCGTILAP